MTAVGLFGASNPPSAPFFPAKSDAQDLDGSGWIGEASSTWIGGPLT